MTHWESRPALLTDKAPLSSAIALCEALFEQQDAFPPEQFAALVNSMILTLRALGMNADSIAAELHLSINFTEQCLAVADNQQPAAE